MPSADNFILQGIAIFVGQAVLLPEVR